MLGMHLMASATFVLMTVGHIGFVGQRDTGHAWIIVQPFSTPPNHNTTKPHIGFVKKKRSQFLRLSMNIQAIPVVPGGRQTQAAHDV
jgi:hypothetical protein